MAFNTSAFLQARQAGANALAGGITSAAGSIVKSIENHQSEAKRLKAFRSMAVDGLGMDAEEVDALDADTLQGKLQAVAVQSEMEKLQREQEDQVFQESQRAAGQRFQQQLAPLAPGVSGPEQPLTPQRMMAAAADSGYQLDPRVIAQFAKDGNEQQTFDPRAVEVGGVPFIVQDKTGLTMPNPVFMAELAAKNKTQTDPSLVLSRRTKALADWNKLISPIEENLSRAEANLQNPKLKQYHPKYEADIKSLGAQLRQLTAERPRFDGEEEAPAKAAPAAKPAQGGYKIGTKYSGLTYTGGDPKQESSWQK